jgi:hypothetical protein
MAAIGRQGEIHTEALGGVGEHAGLIAGGGGDDEDALHQT